MQIDLKNATIKFKDGGSNELAIKIGEGNLTWTEKRPLKYLKNFGALYQVLKADEEAMDVKFELTWEWLKGTLLLGKLELSGFGESTVNGIYLKQNAGSTPPNSTFPSFFDTSKDFYTLDLGSGDWAMVGFISTGFIRVWLWNSGTFDWDIAYETTITATNYPSNDSSFQALAPAENTGSLPIGVWYLGSGELTPIEVLKHIGNASDWVSTSNDPCEPFCVDIEILHNPNCGGETETITLSKFRYEQLDHDSRGGTISCSGKCNATEPVSVR